LKVLLIKRVQIEHWLNPESFFWERDNNDFKSTIFGGRCSRNSVPAH